MISDLIYSANGVLPVFIVALIGYILRNTGFLTEVFVSCTDKLVFKVMLPCMLFTKVAFTDTSKIRTDDFGFAGFCLAVILILTLVLVVTVPVFVKSKASAGAFAQGVFRSNLAILGVPFAENLFGNEGGRLAAILIACVVPLYNVLAVVVLNVFDPSKSKGGFASKVFGIILGIVKNPLIIGIALAVPFCMFDFSLPTYAVKSIGYLSDCATPLALLTIGASFKMTDLKGRFGLAFVACLCKTVVVPALVMSVAYFLFGYKGMYLGVTMILFGTPTAVSSYIMAKNMNSDHKLANQIVLLTTLVSVLTIFMWGFVLRRMGLV